MLARTLAPAPALILSFFILLHVHATMGPALADTPVSGDGIVKVKSVHSFDQTIELLKKDIAGKGIMFFMAVDQSRLGEKAGDKAAAVDVVDLWQPPAWHPVPHFRNPNAGLDWPVRLLVTQDDKGQVWLVYTDFEWIKRRHRIENRDDAFKMASTVISSITSMLPNSSREPLARRSQSRA